MAWWVRGACYQNDDPSAIPGPTCWNRYSINKQRCNKTKGFILYFKAIAKAQINKAGY